ncbi:MAG: archease [Nanoarchaeota archaeon]
MKFRFLDHTADIMFQAFGKTREEAFANAALATTRIITEAHIHPKKEKTIEVKGRDEKQLLYNWLEEFVILLNTEQFILSEVTKIIFEGNTIKAMVKGDDSSNYQLEEDIKAITYYDMEISEENGKWTVQVVVDI